MEQPHRGRSLADFWTFVMPNRVFKYVQFVIGELERLYCCHTSNYTISVKLFPTYYFSLNGCHVESSSNAFLCKAMDCSTAFTPSSFSSQSDSGSTC